VLLPLMLPAKVEPDPLPATLTVAQGYPASRIWSKPRCATAQPGNLLVLARLRKIEDGTNPVRQADQRAGGQASRTA